MAAKVYKSARMGFSLDAGMNPGSGAQLTQSVSVSKLMPSATANALGAVGDAISSLFEKSVLTVSVVETSHIV